MSWWRKLIGPDQHAARPSSDALYVAPRSHAEARVESALPGTSDVIKIVDLVPPPLDPDLVSCDDPERDFAPDPIAEHAVEWPAQVPFSREAFTRALSPALLQSFGQPTLYVRLSGGRITFLRSGADQALPPTANAIIAAWELASHKTGIGAIETGAAAMADWLASRPEGFNVVTSDVENLREQWKLARAIIAVRPAFVAMLAEPRGRKIDGRLAWNTLHAIGVEWGDMDQFQWCDPTNQTDYLFWAEVDDGNVGYALPELIASGKQHFLGVRFMFDIARSPAPEHVLGQMRRAAQAFSDATGCDLQCLVDGQQVAGFGEMVDSVGKCVERLAALGVKPGSSSICILR